MSAALKFPPHPSRAAPRCADCRYAADGFCNHQVAPVEYADGRPMWRFHQARGNAQPCGPEGRCFEPAASPPKEAP